MIRGRYCGIFRCRSGTVPLYEALHGWRVEDLNIDMYLRGDWEQAGEGGGLFHDP